VIVKSNQNLTVWNNFQRRVRRVVMDNSA